MDRVEKVAVLDNEIEAQLVDGLLSDQDIPHVMRSYHDSAYDGLFQGAGGWGHIEAPLSFHKQVMDVIEEIRRRSRAAGTEQADGGGGLTLMFNRVAKRIAPHLPQQAVGQP